MGWILLLSTALCFAQTGGHVLSDSRQVLLVTTPDWSDIRGTAQRFERSRPAGKWRAVGLPFPITVGKTGLAWGRGLHPLHAATAHAPVKKEGDGKAPAGIFLLGPAFGYASKPLSKSRMPYFAVTQTSECVDDSRSRFYNQLVDNRKVQKDWSSSEMMLRHDGLYRSGVFVAHNANPALPDGGSCIFLHIWRGPDHPTVGCTAMQPSNIEAVIRWLDPAKRPVLVQLPADEYKRLGCDWKLPGACEAR